MMDRRSGRTGRGHSREEWIGYHQRMADVSKTKERRNGDEKIMKLTEFLRNKRNKSGQTDIIKTQGQEKIVPKSVIHTGTEVANGQVRVKKSSETTKTDVKESKRRENSKNSTVEVAEENSTRELVVLAEVTVKDRTHKGTQHKSSIETNKGKKHHDTDTSKTNMVTDIDSCKQSTESTTRSTNINMEVELLNILQADDNKMSLSEQKSTLDKRKKPNTVTVKQEMVEEFTSPTVWQVGEDTSNDNESFEGNQSDTSMEDTDSIESVTETDEELPRMIWQQTGVHESPIAKRKAVMGQYDNTVQTKKHLTETHINKKVHHETLHEKIGSQIDTKTDKAGEKVSTDAMVEDTNNDTRITDDLSNNEIKELEHKYTQELKEDKSEGEIEKTDEFDEDLNWEQIASDIDKIEATRSNESDNSKQMENKHKDKSKHSKKSLIRLVLSKNETDEILQKRGAEMIEEKETLQTPVKIEFNLEISIAQFNVIQAVTELFTKMHAQDGILRVLNSNTKDVLWEEYKTLPENNEFMEQFEFRERTYRKGNKKLTVHCIIESTFPINRLKYTEPLKKYIFERNIWIRPDYYLTKTVGSPGFITLLHPRMTNKPQLVQDLQDMIRHTEICQTDDEVLAWYTQKRITHNKEEVCIPPFHIETSVRKWGDKQAEVLLLQCSSEDAKYLKYLLVEACSQKKWQRGLYVPSGIHLMSTKYVLKDLLVEQRNFLDQVTKFHLSGISKEAMYRKNQCGLTTFELLMGCTGVQSIEQTHLTASRGQWIAVVNRQNVSDLTEYIQENLCQIYNTKHGKQQWIVTHQTNETHGTINEIQIIDSNKNRLNTYAEVLRRRFGGEGIHSQQQTSIRGTATADTRRMIRGRAHEKNETENSQRSQLATTEKHTDRALKDTMTIPDVQYDREKLSVHKKIIGQSNRQEDTGTKLRDTTKETTKIAGTSLQEASHVFNCKVAESERNFAAKLQELEKKQEKMIEGFETVLSTKMECMMDTKLKQVSLEVADTVTVRMMHAMAVLLKGKKIENTKGAHHTDGVITQESPGKAQANTETVKDMLTSSNSLISKETDHTQYAPSVAESKQTQCSHQDSPHDKLLFESPDDHIK